MSAATPPTPIRVDFVSDVSCPWCAVGLKSLEQAMARIGAAVPVELHFQPFELNPRMPAQGEDADEHLLRKYGSTPQQLERNREAIRARGAELGFVFNRRERIYNTFDAHRLLHWAGELGRQLDLKRALLVAYFTEGQDVGDREVLARVAESVGLDGDAARKVLAGHRYTEEVRGDEQFYLRAGIHSVPAIIVNRQHLISGGQPPEVFVQALCDLAGRR